MDEISLPFTMQATVTHGEPPPPDPLDEGPLPPGWVRIPVSFQITLSTEILEGGQRGTLPSRADAPVALVPHSLRLGAGPHGQDERTWQDFDALLGALHDDPSTLDAAFHDDWSPAVPVPPWLTQGKLPSFENHDAFLDFLDDPHRHAPAAPPAPGVQPPGPDISATSHPPGGASAPFSQKAAAVAETGLGGRMMVVGAGETALGAATAPEGVGVPVAVEGIATAGTGFESIRGRAQALERGRPCRQDGSSRPRAAGAAAGAARRRSAVGGLLDRSQGSAAAQPRHHARLAGAEERGSGGRSAARPGLGHALRRRQAGQDPRR